jgi:polyhydroxyalkanoate synthesis regulator phasin
LEVSDQQPLTAEETRREIAQLRELLETKIDSLDEKMAARLDAMDRAVELAHSQSTLTELKDQFEDMVERVDKLEKKQ